jgi:hypothetical protein
MFNIFDNTKKMNRLVQDNKRLKNELENEKVNKGRALHMIDVRNRIIESRDRELANKDALIKSASAYIGAIMIKRGVQEIWLEREQITEVIEKCELSWEPSEGGLGVCIRVKFKEEEVKGE